jgi:hypothetical protein
MYRNVHRRLLEIQIKSANKLSQSVQERNHHLEAEIADALVKLGRWRERKRAAKHEFQAAQEVTAELRGAIEEDGYV